MKKVNLVVNVERRMFQSTVVISRTEGKVAKQVQFWFAILINQHLHDVTKNRATAGESVGRPLTFLGSAAQPSTKHMTGLTHTILTRLRQKGKPWAMMLMLNILSTFWGGNGSLATSLGSARSGGWHSSGTCKVFSFPQGTFGIFLRAPDDEKRGIGQCRSIAKNAVYWIISQKEIWMLADYCRKQITFLKQT